MQTLLISYILDPLCQKMSRFSQKGKDRLFLLGGLTIVLLTFLRHSEAVHYRYLYHFIGCIFGLGLMILGSLGREVKPVRFRKLFTAVWFTFGTLQLLSGLRNNSNYLSEAALFLVAYPLVFICWNQAERKRLFRLLIRILRISLAVFAAASWLLSPIGLTQYPGIFTNTNNASYFLCLCVIASLLGLIYGEELCKNLLCLGLASGLNFYTNSRTGTFAIVFALALGLIFFLLRHNFRENCKCLGRLAAGFVAVLVFAQGLVYVYQLRHFVSLPYFDGDEKGIYTASRQELVPENPEKLFGISHFIHYSNTKIDSTGKNLDAYSTGRVSIWLAYAQDLNWTGHETVPPKYIPAYDKEFETTHMTCLQIAYESGIPTGAVFLLLNVLSGFATMGYAWNRGREDYAAGPLMFTVVFGVLSMLGSCGASFGYLTTFLYYLCQSFVIAELPEETI